jgi:hypothetical protein
MPEFDSAEAKNDLSSVGLSFGGSPSGGWVNRMRRASSSNSLTFSTVARTGRMGSAGGEAAATEDPNHSAHVPTSLSSTGPLSPLPFPAPRVHIRSQGARPSTPTQPLASPLPHHAGPAVLHPSGLASPNFIKSHPATLSPSTHDNIPLPQILPSLPTLPILPPHPSFGPSGRNPPRSRSRRGSLLAFSDGDERESRYSPTGSPPESLVFEAPDSTEDVLSRASALLSLEGYRDSEEYEAQDASEKRSEDGRVASASSSLPERPKTSAASIAKDEWSWETFMKAYAEGRWDPFQIPTPPVGSIPAHPSNAPVLRDQGPHRSGSASAPPSSASITAPRPGTPPATSTQSAAQRAESAAIKDLRSSSYTSPRPPKLQLPSFPKVPVMMQKPPLPSPRLESAPHLQAPSTSSHQPHQQSTGGEGQGPVVKGGGGGTAGAEGKRKKLSMQNEEFAATVRLAGATSNLAPFVLPSPDQEHTDPLRNYSSLSSSSSLIQHQVTRSQDGGGKRSVPRKSKSGRFGTSWTASAGGLIPIMAADDSHVVAPVTSRLAVIPGTPATESHDPFSTSPEVSPTNLHLPMATAPLPVTEGKQAVRGKSDGADYFGEPKLWAGGKAAGPPVAGGGEDPLSQLGGDSRRGSASGWGALLARREDSQHGGSAGSDSSTRTILGRGRSYAGPLPGSSSSSYGPSLSSSFSSSTHAGDEYSADMMGGLVLDVSSPGGQIQGRHASEAFEQFLSFPHQADSQSNSNPSSRRSSVIFPPSADSPTPSSDHTTPTHSVPVLPPNLTKLSSASLPGLRPVNGRSSASYAGSGSHASGHSASASRPVAGSKDSRDFDRLGWLPAPEVSRAYLVPPRSMLC